MAASSQPGSLIVSLSGPEIASLLDEVGLPVAPDLSERLSAYLALLLKWNRRTNLTAIRHPREIVLRHFADSLFCASHIPPSAHTLLDFGSGAGFPGIPIALAQPRLHVTLAESQNRKTAFLRETVRSLRFNAEIWPQRAESLPQNRLFDAVTLRAVDEMETACRIAAPHTLPGGRILIFTTHRLVDSIRSALPTMDWERSIALPHSTQGLLAVGRR